MTTAKALVRVTLSNLIQNSGGTPNSDIEEYMGLCNIVKLCQGVNTTVHAVKAWCKSDVPILKIGEKRWLFTQ